MANNLIQIKRSLNTAIPASLANGEMAFTSNGDILYIGANGVIVPVAGKRVPGTLTANQALVANATSGIDKIIVANAAISQLNANGATGTSGQVLKSGGPGANSYWADTAAAVAGSDTQIQFNDGGSLAGAAGLTYNKTSNNVTAANNLSVTANVASNNYTAGAGYGGATAGATVNASTIGVSSNTIVNASLSATQLQITNSTATANLTAIDLKIGTSVVNTTVIAAGANVFANTTTVFVGNSTVNSTHNSALLQVSNSTSTANLTAVALTIGTTVANTSALKVGNTTLTTTNAVFGGTISANGGVGSAGQALISGGAANAYWSTIGNGTVTSVASGNGITGGTITSTGTLYVTAGSGIAVNTTGVHVLANSGIVSNSTGTFVNANTLGGLIANTTLQVKGSPTVVFDGTGNLAVNSAALSFQDLTVSGNLTVLGDLVSMNVATLAVEDPLVVLAKDQSNTTTYTDAVDIGFYGSYGNTAQKNWTGLFRDQSDSGIFKLFSGNIPEPTTTVDTTNVNFAYATMQSYIRTGGAGASGLIANSTTIAITANSTLNVAIVANTLSLATALPTTSGGTGLSTYAVGDLLVGNTSNALTKLAAGTDGYVLQINGTGVVAWNTLDGGTF
jgi:hypothetical protein